MFESLIKWLESHLAPCFFKSITNIECPGCGTQRAFIELLKGNFIESFKTFPALIPMISMLLFLILHLIIKFEKGGTILKYWFIFVVSIMLINYIFKTIHQFNF